MDSSTFFLTYPQSTFTHEHVHTALEQVKPVVWARVAIEQHEDGNPHVHVLVRFGARIRAQSNMRIFDIDGRHPNVQSTRSVKRVLEYISKDGNFKDFGQVPGATSTYDQLVQTAQSGDRTAFDRTALDNRVSVGWATHIWTDTNKVDSNTILEPGQGTECLQLQGLQLHPGSIAIIGPSGCGKSTWAKRVAPKPALWVRHMDDLRKFTKQHKCIIFDDMDFKHMPRTAQIHLVDQDDTSSIHVRYGTVTIPANTQKIFTANEKPFLDDPAINRRVKYWNIIHFAI